MLHSDIKPLEDDQETSSVQMDRESNWHRLNKDESTLLLRLSDRQLPTADDLDILKAITGFEDLTLDDATSLLRACHVVMYDDSAESNDLSYRGRHC